jgi:hypothetical protein
MRPLLFSAVAAAFVAACSFAPSNDAQADSRKDGSIQVTPGMWNWKQETNVLGIPIKEDNLECLIPEKAVITLSKLAYDLDEGCTVDNVAEAPAGFTFKLICKGKTKGKADATLTHTDKLMQIRAKGSAEMLGIPAGFSMKADATYVGDCPPEEFARQKEKWAKEEAEGKPH